MLSTSIDSTQLSTLPASRIMGKTSKKNRGASKKQKGTRQVESKVSETTIAASDIAVVGEIEPRTSASISSRGEPIDSFGQLVENKDYEGILKLESNLVLRATAIEGTEPQKAGAIYFTVAKAFVESKLSSLMAREKAIHYFERSFALSENDIMSHECVRLLVPLYLRIGHHGDEAFATVKRLTVRIPQQELINPDLILFIGRELYQARLYDRVIDILTMFLGTINRSWDKENRAKAYFDFGQAYTDLTEYEKADSFLQKALAITDDPENKVAVLSQMGVMSNFSCNYDDALAALNQALEILSVESGGRLKNSGITALVHTQIGDVLSEQGKHDLEALESFERASVNMKEHYSGDSNKLGIFYEGIGLVHARLGNWDEAIDYLKLAQSCTGLGTIASRIRSLCEMDIILRSRFCEEIGRVRLDQYFLDERLLHDTQERKNVLMEAATCSKKSMEYRSHDNTVVLIGAQVAYLTTEIEEANKLLMAYFEAEMKKKNGIYCRSCKRKAVNGTDIKVCKSCQVVDYCSHAHQTLAWRRGRLSHKVMCPFLKRYRLVAKAKNRIDTETLFEDICKDFFETVCVFKYEVQ
jgi:tetratricopeptide (TPR) repeat protein